MLKVWLPLTKDLRNQGLDDVTVTNNGATFNSAGKLGGCYSFDGSDDFISLNGSTLYDIIKGGSVPFSVTMWVYHADSTRAILFGDYSLSGAINFNIELSTTHYLRFYWNGSPDVNASTALTPLNTWTHVAIVYDGTKIYFYINGLLTYTHTATLSAKTKTSGVYYLGRDSRTGSTALNGKLNDFRIYDHALSQMEVKQLSQGLVLHYPLNRGGWGQENLMPGTYRADGSNTNQIYGWENNAYGNPEIVTKDGSECIHLQANCTGAYTPSIRSASKLFLENGIEYTISCDLMYDKEIKVTNSTPVHYHNGGTDSTDPFNTTNVNNGKGFYWKSISPTSGTIIPANTWQHYEMHLTVPASPIDSSLPYSTYRAFIYGSIRTVSETAIVNMWLKNWKIEKGSIATPWCPNSSDAFATTIGLNGTTEYDCSGFCNNGTRTGTFSWISDTPKYSASTQFNGTQYIRAPFPCGAISEAVSVAVWGYESDWNTPSAERLIGAATGSSGWCIGDYGSENTLFAFYANGGYNAATGFKQLSVGWHHFVITFDGLHLNYYVDGQLFSSKTFSTKQVATGSYNIEIGRHYGDGCNFKGRMSDARIYATALSADDVKSLYQNSAYIDSSGNVYGTIHES